MSRKLNFIDFLNKKKINETFLKTPPNYFYLNDLKSKEIISEVNFLFLKLQIHKYFKEKKKNS